MNPVLRHVIGATIGTALGAWIVLDPPAWIYNLALQLPRIDPLWTNLAACFVLTITIGPALERFQEDHAP